MDLISLALERQHADALLIRIHYPILGNAGFGVVFDFLFVVAFSIIVAAADYFHGEVGACPKFIVRSAAILLFEVHHIGLPKSAVRQAYSEPSYGHLTGRMLCREVL